MNSSLLLASPLLIVLLKGTFLLALGWLAHGILRHQHARWRVMLWRSVFCIGLILPLWQFLEIPGIKIYVASDQFPVATPAKPVLPDAGITTSEPAKLTASPGKISAAVNRITASVVSPSAYSSRKPIHWENMLLTVWVLGSLWGASRLVRLHWQLYHLQRESSNPTPELQQLTGEIQIRLKVHQNVRVRVSDTGTSPFVCGLLKPMILLPRHLVQQLSSVELTALLSHEMAHLRQHDLFWCVGWRWLKTLCWCHPLMWPVPAAHNLACEQEADRLASGQLAEDDAYAPMLARLALRVLALPAAETKLTVNGSSQIARRLHHLGQKGIRVWNWKYSAAGFSLAGLLFLLTAGCELTKAGANHPADIQFKRTLVVVQDSDGRPIEGATILPDGFRVKGRHAPDAKGWNNQLFGPPEKAVTDREGKAYVRYPVEGIPAEKEFTGKLIFSVSHPEYASVRLQEYSVDSPEKPIQMTRGMQLEISGYTGSDRLPVTDLVPNLSEEMVRPEDWQKKAGGVYAFNKLSPGGHIIQLMGRTATGEIVYSAAQMFIIETNQLVQKSTADATHGFFDSVADSNRITILAARPGRTLRIETSMKPGIRLEGRLDDNVPRPVKNGRVLISVRPPGFSAWLIPEDASELFEKYGYFHFWRSWRTIAEDGSFVFESVPPGEVDVSVIGDGFVSKSIGTVQNRIHSQLVKGSAIGIPQPFPLVAPITKITIVTEPSATLEVTAKTKYGTPVVGATLWLNPNILRTGGIFGEMQHSSEEPFRAMTSLPYLYTATTGKDGKAVIQNIPAFGCGMEVDHPQYQAQLQDPKGWRDRYIRLKFSPGATNQFELILEPKGKDYIGVD